ncbi:MAG TPA: hypothetical protein VGS21_07240, partial [Acidimicrobiales bacterium]|nr:hypothetical protein [Acidimicrobiales bacterium]
MSEPGSAHFSPLLGALLEPLLPAFLGRQSWFREVTRPEGGRRGQPAPSVRAVELLAPPRGPDGESTLARIVLGVGEATVQLVVGLRPPAAAAAMLQGRETAVIGSVDGPGGDRLAYDALADDEMLLSLLRIASNGAERAVRARVVESRTSHASVVYDDRLLMKLYRVLEPAPRPEVEVMLRLDEIGFNHIVAPVALWRREGFDLALVREYFAGGLEGRSLALTSLRDLLGSEWEDPGEPGAADEAIERAGGDLASEMRRLGETTARMHVALAEAFGAEQFDGQPLLDAVGRLEGAEASHLASRLGPEVGRLGASIRVEGDYHLRRVMRTDAGWIIVGFGDDPSRFARLGPEGRGALRGSPLDDIADMCISMLDVADESLSSHGASGSDMLRRLADAWVDHNRRAFLKGYSGFPGIMELLPERDEAF